MYKQLTRPLHKRIISLALIIAAVLSLFPAQILGTTAYAADAPSSLTCNYTNATNYLGSYQSDNLSPPTINIRSIPVALSDGTSSYAFCYNHSLDLRIGSGYTYDESLSGTAAEPFLAYFYYHVETQQDWSTWAIDFVSGWLNVAVWFAKDGLLTNYNDQNQLRLLAEERTKCMAAQGYSPETGYADATVDDSLILLNQIVAQYKAGTFGTWEFDLYAYTSAYQPLLVGRAADDNKLTTYLVYVQLSKTDSGGAYLPNAKFGVYYDYACTDKATEITTTSSQWSVSNAIEIDSQITTLYVKEISAPANYAKDTGVYTVTVDGEVNNTASSAAKVYGSGTGGTIINSPPVTPNAESIIQKIDASGNGLGGAVFSIEGDAADGGYINQSVTTDNTGGIALQWLDPNADSYIKPGNYLVKETKSPAGFEIGTQAQFLKLWLEWIADDEYPDGGYYIPLHSGPIVFINYEQHSVTLKKVDSSGKGLAGAVFNIYFNGSLLTTGTSNSSGTITLENVESGYYEFVEVSPPSSFLRPTYGYSKGLYIDATDTSTTSHTITFINYEYPDITIEKYSTTNKPLAGAVFKISIDGQVLGTFKTNASGTMSLSYAQYGAYLSPNHDSWTVLAQEVEAPSGHLLADPNWQENEIRKGQTLSPFVFVNEAYPSIVIEKRSASGNHALLPGAEFEVAIDAAVLGTFTTDASGRIEIDYATYGSFLNQNNETWAIRVVEKTAPDGFILANPNWQENQLIKGQALSSFVFYNEAYPSIVIEKRSASGNHALLPGAEFEVAIDAVVLGTFTTDASGRIEIDYATYGSFLNQNNETWAIRVVEKAAPSGYYIADPNWQENQLIKGQALSSFVFYNEAYPSIVIEKRSASGNHTLLPGAEFEVAIDAVVLGTFTTDTNGRITIGYEVYGRYLNDSNNGWTVRVEEKAAPDGFVLANPNWQENQLLKGQSLSPFVFTNQKKPNLEILKYGTTTDGTDILLSGVTYRIWPQGNEAAYRDVQTVNGRIYLEGLEPGYWQFQEIATISPYQLDSTVITIELIPGETAQHIAHNHRRPDLTIVKICSITGNTLPNTKMQILSYGEDGSETDLGIFYTNENGEIRLESLDPTRIKIVELEPTSGYGIPTGGGTQEVYLSLNEDRTVYMENMPLSAIIIRKTDTENPSNPLSGAVFELRYLGGDTSGTGGVTIGRYTTSESGSVVITGLARGYYIIEEVIPPAGHALSTETTQSVFVSGKDQDIITVTFRNQANPGFLLIKRSAADKATPLPGAVYKITDSNGSAIGDNNGLHTTSADGTISISNLAPGMTLLVQEVEAPAGFVLDAQIYTARLDSSGAYELILYNQAQKTFELIKLDDSDKSTPLQGVEYYITFANGTIVPGGSNGYFYTNEAGKIILTGLTVGDVIKMQETKTKNDSYVLDSTVYTYTIEEGHNSKTLYNNHKGGLLLVKRDSSTNALLSGVQYKITYANGTVVGGSNGLFTTDSNGEIRLTQAFEPGTTLQIYETKARDGYLLDETVHTVVIENPDTLYTVFAYNTPVGGVEVIKIDASDNKTRIANIEFEIRHMNGAYVGSYVTSKNGSFYASLEPGWYTLTETDTGTTGYILDPAPINFEVKEGETTTLRVKNEMAMRILIHKIDAVTGKGIYGVKFLLMDGRQNPLMVITTDQSGYAYIDASDELTGGKYFLKELEAEGYVVDTQIKTVYLEPGKCTTITWENTPICGQIQIIKVSEDYNPTNGLPAGSLLEGAVFGIYDKAGNLVDTIVSDRNGRAVSKLLPLSRYTIREVQAPNFYGVNTTVLTAYLEHEGQIVTFEVKNKSVTTGVSISKTGPKEIVANQPVNYVFSSIANTSTVQLQSFYWRDELPAEVRLNTVLTGSYNFPGTYKIVYKVNGTGDYLTLADHLSTAAVYTLDASAAALGLASNERVSEVMFVFGQVPGSFAQVEAPALYCTAVAGLTGGSSFVNVADVGGVYNGQWVQAVTRWVTAVYGRPETLPRTGY